MRRAPHHGIVQERITEDTSWPVRALFICMCIRPIRCSRARSRSRALRSLAKADRQPALALTDTDNMFGALEFSEKMAGAGIQPIVGCCLAIDFGDEQRDPRNPGHSSQIAAPGAARRERGRLSQPDAIEFARVPGNAAERAIASEIRVARRRNARIDRAHRRAGRRARSRARGRTERSCQCALRQADGGRSAIVSMSNCSATACRRSGIAKARCSISLMPRVCRWSRPTSRFSRTKTITKRMTR